VLGVLHWSWSNPSGILIVRPGIAWDGTALTADADIILQLLTASRRHEVTNAR